MTSLLFGSSDKRRDNLQPHDDDSDDSNSSTPSLAVLPISHDFLQRVFNSPDPPARTIASYLDVDDILSIRNTCRTHRSNIRHDGNWAWMLRRLSMPPRQAPYLDLTSRPNRLNLGVSPRARESYRPGRQIVVVDVSIGDRDVLNLNVVLSNLQAWGCLSSLILDGTPIDSGDVGHLLRNLQTVNTLSLQHCWNINLQLLYKLFKKTPKEHLDEVNFYNHITQQQTPSKCPAEQIRKLRIWDTDGLQVLMDEESEDGHRFVSQISVQFFMRNFDVDLKKCANNHFLFMVCIREAVKCHDCHAYSWVEICPKCQLQSSCEICAQYYHLCRQCTLASTTTNRFLSPDQSRQVRMLNPKPPRWK
ncbi:hypothetical protein DRE_04364 [Drechslerella stenobrocha 248]|uniref:F-box domain-containing protein n=1 Tax=Drechslerella stenobrocha 248 TaxID=1043628 RepID=W7HQH7_9PEZI|nr:hypothetical protein DRE_04364 [Drechslerella stenobrocha 248]